MGATAKIQVNMNQVSKDRINPYIFGHFVEDIRDHMDAMLAYPLSDMDFESNDVTYRGLSGSWRPFTNGKSTVFALEPAATYHSGHSQLVRISSDDEAYAGIRQAISVKKDQQGYALSLYARASVEIKFLQADIVDVATGEVLGSTRIEIESHNWRNYESRIGVSRLCEEAEFRLYVPAEHERWRDHVSTGMLWLDHIALLPSDSIGNVRKEVVDMTLALNAGMMRLAGNYISAYHWQQAIGSVNERPCVINEAWGGWTNKYFGTDEFIQFCHDLQVEPLICVNDGSGTPEEAAEWVEYCNGGSDTPMGKLRAANGHTEPYGVKYWEIGNEVWGPWQVGHCTAEQFADRYVRFAQAMKVVDPEIKLLACGDDKQDWNRILLERAAAHMDYVTLHLYHGYNRFGMNDRTPKEERYKAILSYPEWTRESIRQARELINSDSRYTHLKVAITEYNTMYYPNTIRKGLPNEHTLEAAAANAANLNEFIRNSDLIEIGSFSDLVNGWLGGCIRVGDFYADQFRGKSAGRSENSLTVYGSPTYYVMKMYANRDLSYVVHSHTDSCSFSVNSLVPTAPKLTDLPNLDVVACCNADGNKLTIFMVNRSLEDTETEVHLDYFVTSGTARLFALTGEHADAINDVHHPEAVVINELDVPVVNARAICELKASSVYALEVTR
ncbi:alpha-L-arabinofuranosidase C-terminal domain-containing protein [Paenibacillus oryzisoli]|uniref:non-reducing end alpha-L-arabinofuranosidase n=1 Tax=Paenibacillus oryzisoli TaxID=1850517 RepID=A0A198A8M3_9BACL|nr:alpha-L-arabinofuranosidase C-terminal domain-containing protein [Paenibacillus oryzisoli]OAS17819.1 alpha-L-arabinofuranosidase [Paenibacillus oryzisoli]